MGLRFEIKHANWIAYLIQSDAPVPRFEGESWERKELLRYFLRKLRDNFHYLVDPELLLVQCLMYEGHCNRTLAHCRGDSLDITGSHVANGEHTR